MMMRCLIVEDHPIAMLGFGLMLKRNFPGCELVAATNISQANKHLHDNPSGTFDLAGLGIGPIECANNTALNELEQLSRTKSVPVLILSDKSGGYTDDLCSVFDSHGYVGKDTPEEMLVDKIRAISRRSRPAASPPAAAPVPHHRSAAAKPPREALRLTSRQKDVVDLVLAGYSNKQIAQKLNLSYGTVKNYTFDLMRMLSVNSRLSMVLELQRHGYTS